MALGQSSTPKQIPGTIEFIWAGRIPLPTHQKTILSQHHLFRDPKIDQKRPPDQNVDLRIQNPILGSKIRPWA